MPRKRRARGYIEELPSGSFRAVVYAGTDPLTRKPRYIRETAQSYAGAEVALTRLQRQVDEDAHPKSALTIGQAVAQWLDVAKLEDTTRDRYEDLVRLYIGPTFGDLQAAKLDAEMLEKFYARLQRCRQLLCAALVVAFPEHDPVPHDALELGAQLLDQQPRSALTSTVTTSASTSSPTTRPATTTCAWRRASVARTARGHGGWCLVMQWHRCRPRWTSSVGTWRSGPSATPASTTWGSGLWRTSRSAS